MKNSLGEIPNKISTISNPEGATYKVGIFGWSGTGKTTFIAMLYYLLAKGKVEGLSVTGSDRLTHQYLQPLVKAITTAEVWDDVATTIIGTMDITELNFNVTFRGKRFRLRIVDYPGERVETDKPREILDKYLLACDAHLLFLALEEARSSRDSEFHRHHEFTNFLSAIGAALRKDKIDVPLRLVITKYDALSERASSIVDLKKKALREECKTLETHCTRFDVSAISSKDCFEHYVLKKQSPTKSSKVKASAGDPIDAKDIADPFVRVLEEIRQQEIERRLWPLKMAITAIVLIAIGVYVSLFWSIYSKYRILDRGYEAGMDKYQLYEDYKTLYTKSRFLPLFPPLKKAVREKIEITWLQAEDDFFHQIESSSTDYITTMELCKKYFDRYKDSGRYTEDVQQMYTSAIEERDRVLEEERIAMSKRPVSPPRSSGGGCLGSGLIIISILAGYLSSRPRRIDLIRPLHEQKPLY